MTALVVEEHPAATVTEPAPADVRATRSLARIEGRRLLLSPLLLVPLGLMLVLQGRPGPWVNSIQEVAANSGFAYLLPAAMTLVASNLAALRARRDGTDELFAATPVSARARTGAHLLAVGWPALVSTGLLAVVVLGSSAYGSADLVALADLAVGPLLVAGAGALGVMLARWAPTPVAGPVACVAIAAVELFLTSPAVITTGWRYLAFWFDSGDILLLPPRPALWHLAYLVALVAMAVVGALLRHGLRPRLAVAGIVAVGLMATSAVAQSRYVTSTAWARSDGLLSRPQEQQVCDRRSGVRYCTFGRDGALARLWEPVVTGVRARVPASAWPEELEVSERVTPSDLQYTPQELRARIGNLPARWAPLPDDGALHPGRGWTKDGSAELNLAVAAGSRLVGLPLAPPATGVLCDPAGQARAVVALWLAADATPASGKALDRFSRTNVVPLAGDSLPPHLVLSEDAVQRAAAWGMVEVRHALALQRRPAGQVETALATNWNRFTDPATTTEELASTLGLDRVLDAELGSTTGDPTDHLGPLPRLGPSCGS